jgi:hypothetical protein
MLTAADIVLRQQEMFNGHGQLEISHLSLEDAVQLVRDLSDTYEGSDDLFSLRVYPESDGKLSGAIYQDMYGGGDKLWLSIGTISTTEVSFLPEVTEEEIEQWQKDDEEEEPKSAWKLSNRDVRNSGPYLNFLESHFKPSVLEIVNTIGIGFDKAYDLYNTGSATHEGVSYRLEEVFYD